MITTKSSGYGSKKHISDYNLRLAGTTYFNGMPGKPDTSTLSLSAVHVNSKGFFNVHHLKHI